MKRKNLKKAVSFMLATLMAASAMTQALAVRENPPSNAHIDSSWTMYLVPNAHIDTAWPWPYEDTERAVISDTFSRAITNLKSNENYKSVSYTHLGLKMLMARPPTVRLLSIGSPGSLFSTLNQCSPGS